MRRALLVSLLIAGCATDPPSTGVLVRATADGTLHVHNYLSDVDATFVAQGPVSDMTIAPGGRMIAYDAGDALMIADLVGGLAYAPQVAQPATSAPGWGGGAIVWFVGADGHLFVVPYAAHAARMIAQPPAGWVIASRTGPYLAFPACNVSTDQPPLCAQHVVVESGEGDIHVDLPATGLAGVAFTPDDAALLVIEATTDGSHLARYELASGARTDLGVAAPVAAPLSLDGTEAIALRSGAGVFAVAIDGSGERMLLDAADVPAGFRDPVLTPHGLLYEAGTDVWIDRTHVLSLPDACPRVVSATREHAAWSCSDGLHVISTAGKALLHSSIRGPALDFDRDEAGVVLGGVRATYVQLDGGHADLGEAVDAVYSPLAVD